MFCSCDDGNEWQKSLWCPGGFVVSCNYKVQFQTWTFVAWHRSEFIHVSTKCKRPENTPAVIDTVRRLFCCHWWNKVNLTSRNSELSSFSSPSAQFLYIQITWLTSASCYCSSLSFLLLLKHWLEEDAERINGKVDWQKSMETYYKLNIFGFFGLLIDIFTVFWLFAGSY